MADRPQRRIERADGVYDAALLAHSPDLVLEIDESGCVTQASRSARTVIGLPAERLVGRRIEEIFRLGEIDERASGALVRGYTELTARGGEATICSRFRHADGTWRWIETHSAVFCAGDGARRTLAIARDVTERQEIVEALRHSEGRYRLIAEASGDLVTETDATGHFVYVNRAIRDVLGYEPEDLVGTRPLDLQHPDDIGAFVAALREARPEDPVHMRPHRLRHADGTWLWFEATGVIYEHADGQRRTLGVARDISARVRAEGERRQLEQRMSQAQKLEGLGVMAGGIAHDFNNLLTPILGDASLALDDAPEDSPLRERLERIQRAAQRAATLTNQMLAYAGESLLESERIDLSQTVEEIAELLDTAASRRAAVRYQLARGLPPVEADKAQLSQVVMNLLTNASEALGEDGGSIVVRTSARFASRAELTRAALGATLPEGEYVCLDVEDTGCGITPETRDRIFDPFFTTKFTGRGLGLATVLGIVRRHGGALEIQSAPGRGSRFRVMLPASRGRDRACPAPDRSEGAWRGEGSALVVDDDEAVRELAAETLERAGFSVLTAAGGAEALDCFRKHADGIVFVLLDRTMPGMSGEQVSAAIREIRPDARILLVSGYSRERAAEETPGRAAEAFLQKPFLPEDLVAEVRKLVETS